MSLGRNENEPRTFCAGLAVKSPMANGQNAPLIWAEQVRLLYNNAGPDLGVNLSSGVLTVVVLWGVIDGPRLILWLAALIVTCFGRWMLARAFHRTSPRDALLSPWANYHGLGAVIAGAMWGVGWGHDGDHRRTDVSALCYSFFGRFVGRGDCHQSVGSCFLSALYITHLASYDASFPSQARGIEFPDGDPDSCFFVDSPKGSRAFQ